MPELTRLTLVLGLGLAACTGGGDGADRTGVTGATDTGETGVLTCDKAERDCAGVCFGSATVDDCGQCDENPANDCVQAVEVSGQWACDDDETCQDVWEIQLRRDSRVEVDVTEVTGDSVVRVAVFEPNANANGRNVLVGSNKDLLCTGADESTSVEFATGDLPGTWRIAIGRDTGASSGNTGTYTLAVATENGVQIGEEPLLDDAETQADGARCGNEYRFEGNWDCDQDESCQDTFELDLTEGQVLDLSVVDVEDDSVAGLALYAPGDSSGDTNLLTNTRDDRVCEGRDDDLVAPSFTVAESGNHLLAITRYSPPSAGDRGRYAVVIGADDFFDRPRPQDNDLESDAPGARCEWAHVAAETWDCKTDLASCQDVFDIDVPAGIDLAVSVTGVTGGSAVRAAVFGPGEPLSGKNLLTGKAGADLQCTGPDADLVAPDVVGTAAGTYRVAIGRDAAASKGKTSAGSYDLEVQVKGGYGGMVTRTLDDALTEATTTTCPQE